MINKLFLDLNNFKPNLGSVERGDSIELNIKLLNDEDYSRSKFRLLGAKSDGKSVEQIEGLNLEEKDLKVVLEDQFVNCEGIVKLELNVVSGETEITTKEFYFFVSNTMNGEIVESSDSVPTLEKVSKYVDDAINNLDALKEASADIAIINGEFKENEIKRKANEMLREKNEKARLQSEDIRITEEEEREANELERIQAENDRKVDESNRKVSEKTRVTNERAREEAELSRQSTFEENEEIRNSNENLRIASEQERIKFNNNAKTDELNRKEAEKIRVLAEVERKSSEDDRVAAEAIRQKTYTDFNESEQERKNNEVQRQEAEALRIKAETRRDNLFAEKEEERNTTFIESETVREEAFKISEKTRKDAENLRITAESERVKNENLRDDAEKARITSESERVEKEYARVIAEKERVQAEAKRGKTLEVAKIEIDKINNCFDIVNYLSLEDLRGINAYVDFDGSIIASSNVISLVLKVEENTKYILKSDNITFNRANAICSTEDEFEIGKNYTRLENSEVVQGTIEFIIPEGMRWVCVYVYSGSDYSLETIEENRSNLYLFKDFIPQNKFGTLNKEYLPMNVLYKDNDITEFIGNEALLPNNTTFFNYYNLLDFSKCYFMNGTCNSLGKFTEEDAGKVFTFEVTERKKYFLKLPSNSNRTFLIESNEPFVSGKSYPIVAINNESENVWSFTPNEGIKYIMCYCYNGVEDVINKKDFILTDNLADITKKATVKKENLPNILYEDSNVSEHIKDKSLTPEKCSFFTDYNLFKDAAIENGTVDTTGLFVKGSGGKVLIMPIEGNKHYVLKVPISSNRSFILESTTQFEDRGKYTIIQRVPAISNNEKKLYTFDTSKNAKYVLVYFYYGADVSVNLQDFFLADGFENIDREISLDESYIRSIPKEWEGKKILTMGDSITAINENDSSWPRSWRKYFKEIIKPSKLENTAVPGATWTDKEGTIYDGNPVINGPDENKNNVMGNQIEKILRAKDPTHPNYSKLEEYNDFDVIIMACGTNDTHREIPTNEEIESNFYSGNDAISNLSALDRKTWTGAMRYCIDTLRRLYPNAQIFVTTPIQKTTGSRYIDVLEKNIIIKSICKRLSIPVIDTLECGVYDLSCPTGGQEGDFNDGLHLSPQGAKKLGRYIANNIKHFI